MYQRQLQSKVSRRITDTTTTPPSPPEPISTVCTVLLKRSKMITSPMSPKAAATAATMMTPSLAMSPSSSSTASSSSSASYKKSFENEVDERSEKEKEGKKTGAAGGAHACYHPTYENLERILSSAVVAVEESSKKLETKNVTTVGPATNVEENCNIDADGTDCDVGSTSTCAGTACLTLDGATGTDDDNIAVAAAAAAAADQQKGESRRHKTTRTPLKRCVSSSLSSASSTTEFFRALLERPTARVSSSTSGRRRNHHPRGRRVRPPPQNRRRRQRLLKLARYLQAKTVPVNVTIPPMDEPELAIPTWRMFYEHSERLDQTLQPLLELLSNDDDSISSVKTEFSTVLSSSSCGSRHRTVFLSSAGTTSASNAVGTTKKNKGRSVGRFRVVDNNNRKGSDEYGMTNATTLDISDNVDERGCGDNVDNDREWREECYNLRRSERMLRRELNRIDELMDRQRRWDEGHNSQAMTSRIERDLSSPPGSSKYVICEMSMINTSDQDVCMLGDEISPIPSDDSEPNDVSRTQASTILINGSKKGSAKKNRVSVNVVILIGKTILSLTGIKILLHLQQQHQLQHLHRLAVDRQIHLPRDVAIDLDVLRRQIPTTNSTSNWSKISENDDGVDNVDARRRKEPSDHVWKGRRLSRYSRKI